MTDQADSHVDDYIRYSLAQIHYIILVKNVHNAG